MHRVRHGSSSLLGAHSNKRGMRVQWMHDPPGRPHPRRRHRAGGDRRGPAHPRRGGRAARVGGAPRGPGRARAGPGRAADGDAGRDRRVTRSRSRGRAPPRSARASPRSTCGCARSSISTRRCGRCAISTACPRASRGVDLVIVRENTEGLYSGIETTLAPRGGDHHQGRHREGVHAHRALGASATRASAGARRSRSSTRPTS